MAKEFSYMVTCGTCGTEFFIEFDPDAKLPSPDYENMVFQDPSVGYCPRCASSLDPHGGRDFVADYRSKAVNDYFKSAGQRLGPMPGGVT